MSFDTEITLLETLLKEKTNSRAKLGYNITGNHFTITLGSYTELPAFVEYAKQKTILSNYCEKVIEVAITNLIRTIDKACTQSLPKKK